MPHLRQSIITDLSSSCFVMMIVLLAHIRRLMRARVLGPNEAALVSARLMSPILRMRRVHNLHGVELRLQGSVGTLRCDPH